MIVIDHKIYKHRLELSDGRQAHLTEDEMSASQDEAEECGSPLRNIVDLRAYSDRVNRETHERQFKAVSLVMDGKFTELAALLDSWGYTRHIENTATKEELS